MKRIYLMSALVLSALAALGVKSNHELCEGFLPENDLKIPVQMQALTGGGLTETQFNAALDRVEKHYGPIIAAKGKTFQISRQWTNDTVNASAQQYGNTYVINMFGGLARHPEIDSDGFQLVACHEVGHHLGGAPKVAGWFGSWASNEGQSDYFAGLQCLRRIWTAEENAEFVSTNEIDSYLMQKCDEAWGTQDEINLCVRIGAAGMRVTSLFRALREEENDPHYNTPDTRRVSRTSDSHPATQCRLDTYFQAGLCTKRFDEDLSDTDVARGTCVENDGFTLGTRPRCWYGGSL